MENDERWTPAAKAALARAGGRLADAADIGPEPDDRPQPDDVMAVLARIERKLDALAELAIKILARS